MIQNTQTRESCLDVIPLQIHPAILKEEEAFFFMLKQLCWHACVDSFAWKVSSEGKEDEKQITDLNTFLEAYPKALEVWNTYKPKKVEKKVLEKGIFSFLSALKLSTRRILLELTNHQVFFQKKSEAVSSFHKILPAIGKNGEAVYTLISDKVILPTSPNFSFYATEEDLTPLEEKVTEVVSKQGKKLTFEGLHVTPLQIQAANLEIKPAQGLIESTYTCLHHPIEQTDFRFLYYTVEENLDALSKQIVELTQDTTMQSKLELPELLLIVSSDEKDPVNLEEFALIYSHQEYPPYYPLDPAELLFIDSS